MRTRDGTVVLILDGNLLFEARRSLASMLEEEIGPAAAAVVSDAAAVLGNPWKATRLGIVSLAVDRLGLLWIRGLMVDRVPGGIFSTADLRPCGIASPPGWPREKALRAAVRGRVPTLMVNSAGTVFSPTSSSSWIPIGTLDRIGAALDGGWRFLPIDEIGRDELLEALSLSAPMRLSGTRNTIVAAAELALRVIGEDASVNVGPASSRVAAVRRGEMTIHVAVRRLGSAYIEYAGVVASENPIDVLLSSPSPMLFDAPAWRFMNLVITRDGELLLAGRAVAPEFVDVYVAPVTWTSGLEKIARGRTALPIDAAVSLVEFLAAYGAVAGGEEEILGVIVGPKGAVAVDARPSAAGLWEATAAWGEDAVDAVSAVEARDPALAASLALASSNSP